MNLYKIALLAFVACVPLSTASAQNSAGGFGSGLKGVGQNAPASPCSTKVGAAAGAALAQVGSGGPQSPGAVLGQVGSGNSQNLGAALAGVGSKTSPCNSGGPMGGSGPSMCQTGNKQADALCQHNHALGQGGSSSAPQGNGENGSIQKSHIGSSVDIQKSDAVGHDCSETTSGRRPACQK